MLPTKWLVLQTNDIIVSTKMQTQVIIGNHFIQEENIYTNDGLQEYRSVVANFKSKSIESTESY